MVLGELRSSRRVYSAKWHILAIFFVVFLATSLLQPLRAHAVTDFSCGTSGTYQVDSSGVVTGNTSCVGNLTLDPSVTAIGPNAFSSTNLGAVVIPGNVVTIGDGAFRLATMSALTLQAGIRTIGAHAFRQMGGSGLDISIPDTVTSLGSSAFENSLLGNIVIGNGVTDILGQTFYNNFGYGAESVQFGSGLRTIGGAAFVGYRSGTLDLPEGLTAIGDRAFEGAGSLGSIFLPNSLTSIGSGAFAQSTPSFVIYCGTATAVSTYGFNSASSGQQASQCAKVVMFDANGGSNSMNPQLSTPNQNANLTPNSYSYSGAVFTGWNTKVDGTGQPFTDGQNYNFAVHLKLFAQWRILPRVSFSGNGGNGYMPDVSSDVPAALPVNSFIKCNATFSGWNTDQFGNGTPYGDEAQFPFSSTSTTLYAQWQSSNAGQHAIEAMFGPVGAQGGQSAVAERIWDIEIDPESGDVYIAGVFVNAGGVSVADYIAMWDGSSWNALGNTPLIVGPNGGIPSVTDIAIASNGDVYVTGNFSIPNVSDYVAMWDGSSWHALGSQTAFNSNGESIAISDDGTVFVGGRFTNVAGIAAADYVAVWNAGTWSALGGVSGNGALTRSVLSLALGSGGDLYAAGQFRDAGGIPQADYIARWDGTSWNALGSGSLNNGVMLTSVTKLAVDTRTGQDIVYASAYPYYIDPDGNWIFRGNLWKWDGVGWDQGFSDVVFDRPISDIEIAQTGVIVGGYFLTTGVSQDIQCNESQRLLAFNDGSSTVGFSASDAQPSFSSLNTQSQIFRLQYGYGMDALALGLDGRLFVSGTFLDADGHSDADWLAVSSHRFISSAQVGSGGENSGGNGSNGGSGDAGSSPLVSPPTQSAYSSVSVVDFQPAVEGTSQVNKQETLETDDSLLMNEDAAPLRTTPPPLDPLVTMGFTSAGAAVIFLGIFLWWRRRKLVIEG